MTRRRFATLRIPTYWFWFLVLFGGACLIAAAVLLARRPCDSVDAAMAQLSEEHEPDDRPECNPEYADEGGKVVAAV